jgi:spoIIIJ-associated protein
MAHKGDVFEGRTLDTAVTKGLEALGLSRAEVMITILEEGSGGFLGIGARPYKVRMMRRPGGAPVADTDERGGRGSGRGRRDRERGANGGRQGEAGRGAGERRDRPRDRGDERKRGEPRPERPAGRDEPRPERPAGRDERRPERPAGRDERRPERPAGREERRPERPAGREERRPERPAGREEQRPERLAEREERRPERPAPPEVQHSRPEAGGAEEPGGEGRGRRRRGRRGGRRRHGEPAERGSEADFQTRESPAERAPAREDLPVQPAPVQAELPAERESRAEPPAIRVEVPERSAPPVRSESRERPARDYPREPRREEFDGPGLSADELIAQSTRLTEGFLKAMGFEARISATVDGDHVDVTAEVATDEDLLIGRKGEVRQALQHLLNRILNRGEVSRYHLQLEINDFWKRREEELRGLARSLAEEAVAAGGEVMTEYLNAQERRIVHVTLREDPRVKTYALGTDMIKRVAIAPADFEAGPREERD